MPVEKISIDQVQRLSNVDQLNLLCIFISLISVQFKMKKYFYIDSFDLLHKKNKKNNAFIAFWGKNYPFLK